MKKEKPFNFKWHDFLVAGVFPIIMLGMFLIREPGAITSLIGPALFWYLGFLALIFFLNRHPQIAKDISKGSR